MDGKDFGHDNLNTPLDLSDRSEGHTAPVSSDMNTENLIGNTDSDRENLFLKEKLKEADKRDLETRIKGFVHDYIYKLSNAFLIPFFFLIVSGLIAYHSYMTSKISEIYSEIYQTRAQTDVLLHQKVEDRQEYINNLEARIMKLEYALNYLREENIKLRQQNKGIAK